MVEVTIQLGEQNARMLRSWASVGRLIDSAVRAIDSEDDQDKIAAIEDLQQMKQALSELHYVTRAKLVDAGVKPLWDQNQR